VEGSDELFHTIFGISQCPKSVSCSSWGRGGTADLNKVVQNDKRVNKQINKVVL
jgi:hypothetical protein